MAIQFLQLKLIEEAREMDAHVHSFFFASVKRTQTPTLRICVWTLPTYVGTLRNLISDGHWPWNTEKRNTKQGREIKEIWVCSGAMETLLLFLSAPFLPYTPFPRCPNKTRKVIEKQLTCDIMGVLLSCSYSVLPSMCFFNWIQTAKF